MKRLLAATTLALGAVPSAISIHSPALAASPASQARTGAIACTDAPNAVKPYGGMHITEDTVFASGTHAVSEPIVIESDVSVTGAGQECTVLRVVDAEPTGLNVFLIEKAENVVLQDFTIDGNNANQTWDFSWVGRRMNGVYVIDSSHVTLRNLTVQNMGSNGAVFDASSCQLEHTMGDNHIVRSRFLNNGHGDRGHPGSGVWFGSSVRSSIVDSDADNNGYHGFGCSTAECTIKNSRSHNNARVGFALNASKNSVVENNFGSGNATGAGSYAPSELDYNSGNIIRGNRLIENREHGIEISGRADSDQFATRVEDNVLEGAGPNYAGIYASDGSRHVIVGNEFIGTGRYGVHLNDVADAHVADNTIASVGLGVLATATPGALIENNRVSLAGSGIYLNGLGWKGARVQRNILNGITTDGISVSGPDEVIISNNDIRDSGRSGVRLHLSNASSISRNNVVSGESGVWLGKSARVDVVNNQVSADEQGIVFGVGAVESYLFGNRFFGASTDIYNAGHSTNFGDENGAATTDNWDDIGSVGATYSAPSGERSDINADGSVDAADIDRLAELVRQGVDPPSLDLDGIDASGNRWPDSDGQHLTPADLEYLVTSFMGKKLADANLDGAVDRVDWEVWQKNQTSGAGARKGWAEGDWNGDLAIDARDEAIWLANTDLPEITVQAVDPDAAETGPDAATFVFRRSRTEGDLTVRYELGGSTEAADYLASTTGSLKFGDGEPLATLVLTPVDDNQQEGPEVVTLSLRPDDAYVLGASSQAANARISDNDAPATDRLIVHLAMEDAAGTLLHDSTSHGLDAALKSGLCNWIDPPALPSWTAGPVGGAIEFDAGERGYARIPAHPRLSNTDTVSIAFWIKARAQVDYHRLLSSLKDSSEGGLTINVQGEDPLPIDARGDVTLRVDSNGANRTLTLPDVLDGRWHHLVFTVSAGSARAYVDGVLTREMTYDHGSGFANANDWILAADGNASQNFTGAFDELRIYNRLLTAADVAALCGPECRNEGGRAPVRTPAH